jgi:hypothetical protein
VILGFYAKLESLNIDDFHLDSQSASLPLLSNCVLRFLFPMLLQERFLTRLTSVRLTYGDLCLVCVCSWEDEIFPSDVKS